MGGLKWVTIRQDERRETKEGKLREGKKGKARRGAIPHMNASGNFPLRFILKLSLAPYGCVVVILGAAPSHAVFGDASTQVLTGRFWAPTQCEQGGARAQIGNLPSEYLRF